MQPSTDSLADWPELQRVRRAIVVVDVVESVRLMQADETATIERWRRFVRTVCDDVLPAFRGRLVKSLGDGMLIEFPVVQAAVGAAFGMQSLIARECTGLDSAHRIELRCGISVGDIVADEIDIYGHEVNLAARLAGLARAGEIVVSPEVRAQLVDGLDAELEDLGECWLKNFEAPVRAARIGPAGAHGPASAVARHESESIGIAVLPFQDRGGEHPGLAVGDLLADDLIAQLSRLPQLRVISRLSTSAFRDRQSMLATIAQTLDVQYVVHGLYGVAGGRMRLSLQLSERDSGKVVWADRFEARESAVAAGDESLVDAIVASLCTALVGLEVRRACALPLPTLASHTILLGAIAQLHSLSPGDFAQSRRMLEHLIDRHPRMPAPRAWLGLWHVMRVGQGWSDDPARDASMARQLAAHALDRDPLHALSLSVDGLVCAYVHKDLETAGARYDAAVRANPNEGLAWLFRSAWHAYQAEGDAAVAAALRAQRLSPLDPMRYYYDNFTSTAMLAQGDLRGTVEYGRRSLRANRLHGPTLRILAIAYALAGDWDQARAMVESMCALEPGFSVSAFRRRYPGRDAAQVERYARALAAAGLPP